MQKLVQFTELFLTFRLRRKARRRLKQQQKNIVLDWIEAFLQAAFLVLLINQYFFQAYQIPSGSMIPSFLLGDRLFVNKIVYGPELLPNIGKLPGVQDPYRGDIIIFENPAYINRGTFFTVLQRLLYMLTLSLIDIDKDERGLPRAQLLIKRAVGVAEDRFRITEGNMLIKPAGLDVWYSELHFQDKSNLLYPVQRLIDADDYPTMRQGYRADILSSFAVFVDEQNREAAAQLSSMQFIDPFLLEEERQFLNYAAFPSNSRLQERVQFLRLGWYVPEGYILPLGDNRDNSRDGRYFGVIHKKDVLGRASFIYWPLQRMQKVQ